jgi:hypothetical protein
VKTLLRNISVYKTVKVTGDTFNVTVKIVFVGSGLVRPSPSPSWYCLCAKTRPAGSACTVIVMYLYIKGRGPRWWECCGLSNSRLVVVAYIFIRRRITRVYMAGLTTRTNTHAHINLTRFDYERKQSRVLLSGD